ncbi:hypothetical protein FQR65_LT02497 [Abscondita terminalis]|nr:hypothetical protein FQR65_LT02497 [Abscondita terminalis]
MEHYSSPRGFCDLVMSARKEPRTYDKSDHAEIDDYNFDTGQDLHDTKEEEEEVDPTEESFSLGNNRTSQLSTFIFTFTHLSSSKGSAKQAKLESDCLRLLLDEDSHKNNKMYKRIY